MYIGILGSVLICNIHGSRRPPQLLCVQEPRSGQRAHCATATSNKKLEQLKTQWGKVKFSKIVGKSQADCATATSIKKYLWMDVAPWCYPGDPLVAKRTSKAFGFSKRGCIELPQGAEFGFPEWFQILELFRGSSL